MVNGKENTEPAASEEKQTMIDALMPLLIEWIPEVGEAVQAIQDIPGQMEIAARVELAKSFIKIVPGAQGQEIIFFREQFEAAWNAIYDYPSHPNQG